METVSSKVIINNIEFTDRQTDIIACIACTNMKNKKIFDFLDLREGTLKTHLKSIYSKTGLDSRAGIKSFIKNSNSSNLIIERCRNLYIDDLLRKSMEKIHLKIKNNFFYLIDKSILTNHKSIIKFLKKAGIGIEIKTDKKLFTVLNRVILIELKEYYLKNVSIKQYKDIIFICFDEDLKDKVLLEYPTLKFIDCTDKDYLYSKVFEILELTIPEMNLQNIIEDFEHQKRLVLAKKIEIIDEEDIDTKIDKLKKSIFMFILIFLSIGICSYVYTYYSNNNLKESIQSNYEIQYKELSFQRAAINQLDEIYKKNNGNNKAVLIGPKGSGKSTTAKIYGEKFERSLKWEINAESEKTLAVSFERLAKILVENKANAIKDREELNKILNIVEIPKKNLELSLFCQKRLKSLSSWFIIFDNVKSLKFIKNYLPKNSGDWGNGKIIINTEEISSNEKEDFPDSIIVVLNQISENEKLKLFMDINHSVDVVQAKRFLKNIPSYPLDVYRAADYIKVNNEKYDDYLKILNLNTSNKEKINPELEKIENSKKNN